MLHFAHVDISRRALLVLCAFLQYRPLSNNLLQKLKTYQHIVLHTLQSTSVPFIHTHCLAIMTFVAMINHIIYIVIPLSKITFDLPLYHITFTVLYSPKSSAHHHTQYCHFLPLYSLLEYQISNHHPFIKIVSYPNLHHSSLFLSSHQYSIPPSSHHHHHPPPRPHHKPPPAATETTHSDPHTNQPPEMPIVPLLHKITMI